MIYFPSIIFLQVFSFNYDLSATIIELKSMNGVIKNNGSTKKIRDQIEIWWLGGKIYKFL